MSLPLEFNPAVRDEVVSAHRWYENQRPGLGSDFLDAVENLLAQIGSNPHRFGIEDRDVRAGPLTRFPYAIYYRVLADRIRVLAIYHTSRDPAGWRSRN